MRATTALGRAARLCLLAASLVGANYDSRGPEVEAFYRAYRMDVDISVAEFLADPKNEGKDPNVEKPWQLGRDLTTQNEDLDWPKGNRPSTFYGLNFHAWAAGTARSGGYGRIEARTRIDDPVNPDFKAAFGDKKDADGNYVDPRRNIMRLPRDSGYPLDQIAPDNSFKNDKSVNKWSWDGFDPNGVLGGLNQAKKGTTKLGNYFEFDNILGIVGKRCSDLYQKNPTLGKAHYEAIASAFDQARLGREMESRIYQKAAAIKVLEKYELDKKLQKGTISRRAGILKMAPKTVKTTGSWYEGWKYEVLDIKKTKNEWPDNLKSHKNGIFGDKAGKTVEDKKGRFGIFSDKWAAGDFSYIDEKKGDRVTEDGMGSNHKHLQVMRAETRLSQAIKLHINDPNGSPAAVKCNWYRDPGQGGGGNGGLPDPLRKRLAITPAYNLGR